MNASEAARPRLDISVATQEDAIAWAHFLRDANDATLFHELPFLAYHPPGRFKFENLIVRRTSEIVAIVPGGVVERDGRETFVSPLGASVGGPVLSRPILSDALEITLALQAYAIRRNWAGLKFVLPPCVYQRRPSDTTGFALLKLGFRLVERDLTFVIPLEPGKTAAYATLFRKRQASRVRAALRRGVRVLHGGTELLEPFLEVFRDTYERHGVAATHSEVEIADLLLRLPERVELCVTLLGDIPLAGTLVFRLNAHAAYTFYICSSTEHASENGMVVTFAALIDRLADAGVRVLDLGPSATTRRMNDGVVFFKEGLGAVGQARDHWEWVATTT